LKRAQPNHGDDGGGGARLAAAAAQHDDDGDGGAPAARALAMAGPGEPAASLDLAGFGIFNLPTANSMHTTEVQLAGCAHLKRAQPNHGDDGGGGARLAAAAAQHDDDGDGGAPAAWALAMAGSDVGCIVARGIAQLLLTRTACAAPFTAQRGLRRVSPPSQQQVVSLHGVRMTLPRSGGVGGGDGGDGNGEGGWRF
jgi:hypothetical protein